MNVKALTLAGASVGVAVATMVVLNLAAPIRHAEEAHTPGVTADQVFGASIAEPGESAFAPASEAPQVEVAAVEAAATASDAGSFAPGAEVEVAQAEVAAEPAPEAAPGPAVEAAPAVAGGSCETGITDGSAAPVSVPAGGYPGSGSAPVEAAAAAPEPAPTPAVEEPAPAPAIDEPAPVVAEASPEPAAEPAPAPKPKAKPKPKAPKVAPAEAKIAWWPAKSDGKLNLTYAGDASFTKAIVLLFDGSFESADSANQNVKVTTRNGGAVAGNWLVATGNKQMLLFNAAPGVYKVSVGAGLTDAGGRAVSAASNGVVFVP